MPNDPKSTFPGKYNSDYRLVSYGGRVYIVYALTLPGGKTLEVSWRLSEDELKVYAVNRDKIEHVGEARFGRIQHLGGWDQVSDDVIPEEHPFSTWLKKLQKLHGAVSWLADPQFMSRLIEGWAEGWTDDEVTQSLEQTKWYQSRTERQRVWEMDMSKAERRAELKTTTQQVGESLRELYGADFDLKKAGITQEQVKKWADQIASGQWGDPSEGFQFWLAREQRKAQDVEGTPAWIDQQRALEEQRAFANRPEDLFVQLQADARRWLGPLAVPSDETLKQWATDLVTEVKSDADWQQFLQKRSQKLYPFLDAETPWQEFADPYKSLLERTWGTPTDWDNPLLQQLGQADEAGKPTGSPVSFYDFEVLARQDPKFWGGPLAREEGYGLLNKLNEVFRGVTS